MSLIPQKYKIVVSFEGKLDYADWEFYAGFEEILHFKILTLKLGEEFSDGEIG